MTDTVTVEIRATTRVYYAKFIELPRADFERIQHDLENLPGRDQQRLEEELFHKHFDTAQDWQDEDDIEISDFDLKPDEDHP